MAGLCLTHHAVERYRKRWAPDRPLVEIRKELWVLAQAARPEKTRTLTGQQLWSTTHQESKIYFVVKRDKNRRHAQFVCVTILPYGSMGSQWDPPDSEEDILDREHEVRILSELKHRILHEQDLEETEQVTVVVSKPTKAPNFSEETRCDLCTYRAAKRYSRKKQQKWCEHCYQQNREEGGRCPLLVDWQKQYLSKEGLKVVFVDFDGVLNNRTFLISKNPPPPDARLDPVNVNQLARLAVMPRVVVIVTSTWRFGKSVDSLRKVLRRCGYRGALGGMTSQFMPSASRAEEIQAWLDEAKKEGRKIGSFVILDDDSKMGHLTPHLIAVDPSVGLTKANVNLAIKRLFNSDPEEEKNPSPPSR